MWWKISLFAVIALAGIICNGMTLISVFKYRILRKKSYTVVVSLATCDLFKVAVVVNILIYSAVKDLNNICTSTSALGMTLECVTTFHLAAESINRCLIILYPYRYLDIMKKKYVALCVLFIWFVPATTTIVFPAAFFKNIWVYTMYFQAHMYGCDDKMERFNGYYVLVWHVLMFALPLIFIIASYAVILKIAYKNAAKMRQVKVHKMQELVSPAVTKTAYSCSIISMVSSSYDTAAASSASNKLVIPNQIIHVPKPSVKSKLSIRMVRELKYRKYELKASRTALVIITAFLLCNVPTFSVSWHDILQGGKTDTNTRHILTCLSFLQVIINPVVYFLRLKDFKNARRMWKYPKLYWIKHLKNWL